MADQAQSKILAEIKQDVFGRKGDFITSPEISQVFGEVSSYSKPQIMIAMDDGDERMHAKTSALPSYAIPLPIPIGNLGIRSSSY
jgi:hypothetical protein